MKTLKQNKKADLPTLILVLLIFALLTTTLFSFYFAVSKQAKIVNDVAYLRELKNFADSVKYSVNTTGEGASQWYEGVNLEDGKIIIERSFDEGNLKAKYTITP